ncbi:hypothetical protein NQD34_016607 [Periophthalmus magnuspinnatus]|nr:hypothetical protein NQD34_016607 [Periophthalmus magnuspinnatus]
MSNEDAELELKEAQKDAPAATPASAPGPADTDATEADVSETDLEADTEAQEKAPMTEGEQRDMEGPATPLRTESNGAVKLKIPEDEPEPGHFTGLNKEQLMRVAGTPGWVRTRWALLVLFWLAWLGMLDGAVLLILKAPPCKELPALRWWNEGPLFQIRSLKDFSESGDIKGVEQQLDSLLQMKVRALVLGPIHEDPKDDPTSLSFEQVSAAAGSLDQIKSLVHSAHKRGLMVVLDLTPNYSGSSGPWFSNSSVSSVAKRLESALVFWLGLGVDGVKLDSVDLVWAQVPSQWNDIRAIVQNWTDSRPHKRLLLGSTPLSSPSDVSTLLGDSGVDLLLSSVLSSKTDAMGRAQTVQLLSSAYSPAQLLWNLEPAEGAVPQDCDPMDLMLLLTLPGTALIEDRTRDQAGIRATLEPRPSPCPLLLSSLSSLRAKERSLLYGDFSLVYNSSVVLVYLRSWDQSPRFLVLFNYSPDQVFSLSDLQPEGGAMGTTGKVVLSSNATILSPDLVLDLNQGQLGPQQSVLLRVPHS